MKGDWQELTASTAEWLFLSQGMSMLTVKGIKGGEIALVLPSSYAESSAAFGRSSSMKILEGSSSGCNWKPLWFFS